MSSESYSSSLWWNKNEEPAPIVSAATGTKRFDVAVVGGGFTGLSSALHLAEAGLKVGVFEERHVGFGASGRNGGQVIPGLKYDPSDLLDRYGPERGEKLIQLVGNAPDYVFELIDKHDIRCSPERSGWIQAAHSQLALGAALKRAAEWQARGVHVDILDKTSIRDLSGISEYNGGWRDSRAGSLQPLDLVRGLARATLAAGGEIYQDSKITAMTRSGAEWRLETANAEIIASKVIVATNAYTGPLVPGLAKSILPVQSIKIATEPLSAELLTRILPSKSVLSELRKLSVYMRLSPDGRFMVGGRGAVGKAEDPALAAALEKRMIRLFPDLEGVKIDYRWTGHLALTLDNLPHFHEDQPGRYSLLAFNGRGIALSIVLGRMLADEIANSIAAVYPRSKIRPIAWHSVSRSVLGAGIRWYWMKDSLGFASK